MATEIELKLLIDPVHVRLLRRVPLLQRYAVEKPVSRLQTSTYFDTPDLDLQRAGASLRVRRVNRTWIQTFKTKGYAQAGLHQRGEWESRVANRQPDLAALVNLAAPGNLGKGDPALLALLSEPLLADRLRPLFTTRFKRTAWSLKLTGFDEVELALDRGEVLGREAAEPISEIELELRCGDPARLFDVALELIDTVPLRVGNISKAARGYALCAPQPPPPVKAQRVELSSAMSVEQGFECVLRNCLAQVQANETGVAQSDNPESVHQMRVGLRRLRAGLSLFSGLIPKAASGYLAEELRWIAGTLGSARDWEVLATETLPALVEKFPDDSALAELRSAARNRAGECRNGAREAVMSVRYTKLLLSFGAWIEGRRWRAAVTEPGLQALTAPLPQFAGMALKVRHKRLMKHGRRLKKSGDEERHATRIAAKKQRYAAEFFSALCAGRRVEKYVRCLAALQDSLGQLNDAATAAKLLAELTGPPSPPERRECVAFVTGWLAGRSQAKLAQLAAEWKVFDKQRALANK